MGDYKENYRADVMRILQRYMDNLHAFIEKRQRVRELLKTTGFGLERVAQAAGIQFDLLRGSLKDGSLYVEGHYIPNNFAQHLGILSAAELCILDMQESLANTVQAATAVCSSQQAKAYVFTDTGLELNRPISFKEALAVAAELNKASNAWYWQVGDLLNAVFDAADNDVLMGSMAAKMTIKRTLCRELGISSSSFIQQVASTYPKHVRNADIAFYTYKNAVSYAGTHGVDAAVSLINQYHTGELSKHEFHERIGRPNTADSFVKYDLGTATKRVANQIKRVSASHFTYKECSVWLGQLEPVMRFYQNIMARQLFLANECGADLNSIRHERK